VSAQGIDECMINVHYYYYYHKTGLGVCVDYLMFTVVLLGQQSLVDLEDDPIKQCSVDALGHGVPRGHRLVINKQHCDAGCF